MLLYFSIIVLLIFAGISIQAITNTGIFTQAKKAKRESEIANIKEQIQLDIYEKQLQPPLGDITQEQLETILGKYGTVNHEEDGTIIGITTVFFVYPAFSKRLSNKNRLIKAEKISKPLSEVYLLFLLKISV